MKTTNWKIIDGVEVRITKEDGKIKGLFGKRIAPPKLMAQEIINMC